MIVDQPATIGALAVGLAQAMNIIVAYLPGLTMRRVGPDLVSLACCVSISTKAHIATPAGRSNPSWGSTLNPRPHLIRQLSPRLSLRPWRRLSTTRYLWLSKISAYPSTASTITNAPPYSNASMLRAFSNSRAQSQSWPCNSASLNPLCTGR